ncbi:hypothetical protein DIPPA_11278 [Diplonema papillatum]|nr:hypothetical protein DIPPA_11278 [Diplonema papillatum]
MYKEFTAVILAGGEGTRLAPLAHGKAVMPVCNHAMMGYAGGSLRVLPYSSKPFGGPTRRKPDQAWSHLGV